MNSALATTLRSLAPRMPQQTRSFGAGGASFNIEDVCVRMWRAENDAHPGTERFVDATMHHESTQVKATVLQQHGYPTPTSTGRRATRHDGTAASRRHSSTFTNDQNIKWAHLN